jgi:hypothetical protein
MDDLPPRITGLLHHAMIAVTIVTVAIIALPAMTRGVIFTNPTSGALKHRPSVTSTTAPAGCPVSTLNVPDGPDPWGGCFPGSATTGVPTGTSLTTYSGPCTITTNNTTIDAKDMTACEPVYIQASNVTITRSRMVQVFLDQGVTGRSVTVSDSDIDRGQDIATAQFDRAIEGRDWTIIRTDVQGGYSTGYCWTHCTSQDSYFHNQWQVDVGEGPGNVHASALRQENNLTVAHSTIFCQVTFVEPDNGCSADISGYPDFGPIHDNTYDNTLMMANIWAGFCGYGGATGSKPFSGDPLNATNIKWRNNIFQKGASGTCGAFGPFTDFDDTRTGNEWTNNLYDDGSSVPHG